MTRRAVAVRAVEPGQCPYPGVRCVIRVYCQRDSGSGWESRYYVSSLEADSRTPLEFLGITRAHWAVENKNHWRKDAVLREDDTRCRDPNIVGNLALLAQVVLCAFETVKGQHDNFKAWIEHNRANEKTLFTHYKSLFTF